MKLENYGSAGKEREDETQAENDDKSTSSSWPATWDQKLKMYVLIKGGYDFHWVQPESHL